MLNLNEMRKLQASNPEELLEHLSLDVRRFLFGVVDQRQSFRDSWGGELMLVINQNLELHLVPFFTDGMRCENELPQFSIMPSEELAGSDRAVLFSGDDETGLSPYEGVIFFVKPLEYQAFLAEIEKILSRYDDFMGIPDVYFLNTALVHLVTTRVLKNSIVKQEQRFDFSKHRYSIVPPEAVSRGEVGSDESSAVSLN